MSSVRKKDQTPHRFTVLDLVLDVYDHTTTLLANEKVFDPKYQTLINRIDNAASMAYHCCRAANEDYDNRDKTEAQIRLRLEAEASVRYGNYHKLVYRLNRWYEGLWKARTP